MNLFDPLRRIALALLGIAALGACDDGPGQPVERDFTTIQQRDTVVAIVTYNETGYFIYRGRPMGMEYDLLRQFAGEHDLVLDVHVVREPSRVLHLLADGEGDVVAARLIPNARDTLHVEYTRPLYTTRPALVQQGEPPESADIPGAADTLIQPREEPAASQDPRRIQARLISEPGELADQEIHVPGRAFYHERLVELEDSLDGSIHVVEVDSASHEALIRQLARGDIRLTVAPENVAQLKASVFTNITVQPVIGPRHEVVWGVRENAPQLLAALNEFLEQAAQDGTLHALYQRYFIDRQGFRERAESEYLTSETGQLSEYDDLFRQHAPTIGWDWRLLASQAYQESLFNPRARSWAGAMGILQLMPATAREVGVSNPWDPAENIAGGVRYLNWLNDRWVETITDEDERLRFILASYNAGFGHVSDARRLAEKNGDDPNDWEDVAYWLLQKSKPEVYRDPVVRYGYARGLEPVTYVSLILERFDHYQEFVVSPDDVAGEAQPAP